MPMYKACGFTLVELVIVIVILGILGAVAAPRFINMQGNAYQANLQELKGAIETAAALAHTKAVLKGYDKLEYVLTDSNFKRLLVGNPHDENKIEFSFGYPQATGNGIIKMMQNKAEFTSEPKDRGQYLYTHRDQNDYTRLSIALRHRHKLGNDAGNCELIYQAPKAVGQAPNITLYTDGC